MGTSKSSLKPAKLPNKLTGQSPSRWAKRIVIVAAVGAAKAKEGQDFFPLTVDYREKAAAAGKFPGGYFKREGRPTEKEILTSRFIDRPIRPLFPKGWYNEVQVQCIVLSADGENDPDILAINGASRGTAGERHSVGGTAGRRARWAGQGAVCCQPHPHADGR